MAGIFPRAALFSQQLAGAKSITLQFESRRVSPPGAVTVPSSLPFPSLAAQGRGEQPHAQVPGTAGQAEGHGHFWFFTASTAVKECFSTIGVY